MSTPARLVVGVSGASGVVYGLRALDACRDLGVQSHLIFSKAAALTLAQDERSRRPSLHSPLPQAIPRMGRRWKGQRRFVRFPGPPPHR